MLHYINVPMTGLTPPTNADITRILVLLETLTAGGVFVHCMRGAHRTGAVIGTYRIDHDHSDNYRAWKEAKSLGMSLFQLPRRNFIRKFSRFPGWRLRELQPPPPPESTLTDDSCPRHHRSPKPEAVTNGTVPPLAGTHNGGADRAGPKAWGEPPADFGARVSAFN